jgi:RNA ligase-like protein
MADRRVAQLDAGPRHQPHLAARRALSLADRIPPDFAIQGEVCGPGTQKNRLGLDEVDLLVFNVYDLRAAAFLPFEAFRAFCADRGLRTVPIERVVEGDEAAAFGHSLDEWLKAARGFYTGTKQRKEGIVVRPLVEQPSATLGGRLSFKVINNDFLRKCYRARLLTSFEAA